MKQEIKNIHDELISVFKIQTSEDSNPVEALMKILSIGKEGAYRRLRGEIQLSLDEAITLSKQLDISLDNLIEINWEDKYVFHIAPFSIHNSLAEYRQTLTDIMNSYIYVKEDPDSIAYIVGKVFVPTFYFKYKEFTKFTLFKWIYQYLSDNPYPPFSEIALPPQLEELAPIFIQAASQIRTTFILNDYIFTSLANDLIYFHKINLLTSNEVEILKEQSIMIINDMEKIALDGSYQNGTEVCIYIADSYFDTSYHYLSGNGFEACGIGIYGLNFLSCQNNKIAHDQKIWIESLIKCSTSITQCGKIQRIAFFNKQRKKFQDIEVS